MHRVLLSTALASIALSGAGLALLAEGGKGTPPRTDPEAARVIANAIAALGGEEAYRRSADYRLVYEVETLPKGAATSVKWEWVLYSRADGAIRIEKKILDEKEIIGFDGKEYWFVPSGRTEASPAPDHFVATMRLETLQQSLFLRYELLGYVALYRRPEAGAQGLERVIFARSGAPEEREKQQPGDRFQYWFDTKTHLVARFSAVEPTQNPGKTRPRTIDHHDYATIDGFPTAKRLVYSSDDKEILEAILVPEKSQIGKPQDEKLFQKPK